MPRHDLNVMHYRFYFMKCKCNAKSFVQPVFCVFLTTFTMPSRNPPTSTRCGKGFTKAETTTFLKTIEQILPIDTEAWNEVHDVFNSKHTPRGVEFEAQIQQTRQQTSSYRQPEYARGCQARQVYKE